MFPVVTVGSLEIRLYLALRVTALVLLVAGVLLRLRRSGLPVTVRIFFLDALPWLVVGLTVGSAVENGLPYLFDWLVRGVPLPPEWWAGSRWLGALAGVSLTGYLYCRRRDLPAGRAFDLFAAPAALALAVARFGCLMAGCCYGRETTAWFALVLPDSYGNWVSRYPTQLADIVANLLIFALLLVLEGDKRRRSPERPWPFEGFFYLLFVLLHLGQRFVIEFWRADTPSLWGPLTWPHVYCVLGMVLSAALIGRGLDRGDGRFVVADRKRRQADESDT